MITDKKKHCPFAKLNTAGKCIAVCHINSENSHTVDCMGVDGKTEQQFHEAKLTMDWRLDR